MRAFPVRASGLTAGDDLFDIVPFHREVFDEQVGIDGIAEVAIRVGLRLPDLIFDHVKEPRVQSGDRSSGTA